MLLVPPHIHPPLTPRCQSTAEVLPKTGRAPCGKLQQTAPSTKQAWHSRGSTPSQPRLAQLTAASLTPSEFIKQSKQDQRIWRQLHVLPAQPLKETPWLPGRVLLPQSLRGQLQLSGSGWYRQSHPVSAQHLPVKETADLWSVGPAPFPRATQPTLVLPSAHENWDLCYCCQGTHARRRAQGYRGGQTHSTAARL